MLKKTMLCLTCSLFLCLVCFSYHIEAKEDKPSNPKGFTNYKQAIKKIKGKYEDAWIAELPGNTLSNRIGIKYVQAAEKKYLNEDPAPSDLWLVTKTGNIFKAYDLISALKDLKYFPVDDAEAITIASMIIRYKSDCVNIITGNELDADYMPQEFLKIGKKASVSKDQEGSYNVILYVSLCSPPRYFGSTHFTLELNKIKISKYEYNIYENTIIKKVDKGKMAQ